MAPEKKEERECLFFVIIIHLLKQMLRDNQITILKEEE